MSPVYDWVWGTQIEIHDWLSVLRLSPNFAVLFCHDHGSRTSPSNKVEGAELLDQKSEFLLSRSQVNPSGA